MLKRWLLYLLILPLVAFAPVRTDIPVVIPVAVEEISVGWALCFADNHVYMLREGGSKWLVDEGGMAACLQRDNITPPNQPVGFIFWR